MATNIDGFTKDTLNKMQKAIEEMTENLSTMEYDKFDKVPNNSGVVIPKWFKSVSPLPEVSRRPFETRRGRNPAGGFPPITQYPPPPPVKPPKPSGPAERVEEIDPDRNIKIIKKG